MWSNPQVMSTSNVEVNLFTLVNGTAFMLFFSIDLPTHPVPYLKCVASKHCALDRQITTPPISHVQRSTNLTFRVQNIAFATRRLTVRETSERSRVYFQQQRRRGNDAE
uniref:Uncharacterized protein n=1 Tax=Parascaris univalens TaxID=6257 RepID=A0A915BF95_PARUN